MTPFEILNTAVNNLNAKMPEFNQDAYCGFAYVTIRPARGKFVNYLKSIDFGYSGVYGGWTISMGKFTNSQSMTLKEEMARFFADELKSYGINATVSSRAD